MKPMFLNVMLFFMREASATPSAPTAVLPDENLSDADPTNNDDRRLLRSMRVDTAVKESENLSKRLLASEEEEEEKEWEPLSRRDESGLKETRDLSSSRCKDDEKFLTIKINTDGYGFETSWVLFLKKTSGASEQLYYGPPTDSKYDKNRSYVGGYCLSPGDYKFVISDLFKDGMCCDFGRGKYEGKIDDEEIFSSPEDDEDWEKRGHQFTVSSGLPLGPRITGRDVEWLDSHNTRRQEWHQWYGKRYVPLQWSNALEEEARNWAEKLAVNCKLVHDPNSIHGENIALNYGWGEYGGLKATDNVLSRYVEDEADYAYPSNGHLTQVLWRSTKYVGCADASRPYDGGRCHTQVCRYARPGNCNMSYFKSNKSEWWITPMLMDQSDCGRECPPDGCR